MAVSTPPKAEVFSLHTPLLSEGRTTTFVARAEMMSVAIKVYSEGGENALHTHASEDHAFVVLDGEATFYDQDDNARVVKKYEGIMLPAGAFYWFQSTGNTNLVLLRTAGFMPGKTGDDRLKLDGSPLPSESAENKHITGVPVPGKFFGD